MQRLDVLVGSSLVSLACFVFSEALDTRSAAAQRAQVEAHGRTGAAAASIAPPSTTPTAAPTRLEIPADVRSRLERYAPSTYIGELLAAHDSAIARWPDRRGEPLRVWIQPTSRVADWTPAHVGIVRDAFQAWSEAGIPLSFSFVVDSAAANVHVSWTDEFTEPISGKTLWTHDERWFILDAKIVIAVHHKSGDALDRAAMQAISLHEVGHLLGLDHTTDTTSIMAPRVRVRELSPVDRATGQLLYSLPPGRLGTPTR